MSQYSNRRMNPRYAWPAAPKPGPFYRKETPMANETKHTPSATPGPWLAYIGPIDMNGGLNPFFRGTVALIKHSGEGNDVAVILDRNEDAHDYEANARLIAAAPDLLKVAQSVVYVAEHSGSNAAFILRGLADDARATLAKATGAPQ